MIVVDTNVIAYLFLNSDQAIYSEALLRHDPEWAVPVLWRSEFRNILALYLRKKIITLTNAEQIMEAAEKLVDKNEYAVPSRAVLEYVNTSSCSAYDCEFVCLAENLNTYLVTADKKILKSFPKLTRPLSQFS